MSAAAALTVAGPKPKRPVITFAQYSLDTYVHIFIANARPDRPTDRPPNTNPIQGREPFPPCWLLRRGISRVRFCAMIECVVRLR